MSNIPSLFSRLRYYFDQTIASGTGFLLLWIAAISLIIIAIGAVLLSIGAVPTGEEPKKFGEAFWSALNMALDPRAVENPGWSYRAVMLSVAILGILIVSTLIGILTSGIGEKLDELRRGRSQIFEKNHTLILGWSEKIGPIIRELIIANENMRDAVVVVLADRDKVEMEEKLTAVIGDPKSTRLICRRGKPSDLSNLNMVSPHTARSFIILREEFADSDDDVIKAILALRQICGSPLTSPIVAEIVESANADAASRIEPKVSVINANELVLRIIAQAAREPGLSRVYEEILSFAGAEIYSQREPRVEGMSFAKASEHYESSILIGLLDPSGRAVLNPPSEQLIKKGESLIAIAEDDDQIIYSATEQKPPDLKRLDTLDYVTRQPEKPPEKILILGWHLQAKLLLKELDELLPTGSEVLLTYNSELVTEVPKIDIKKTSIKCTLREGDTTDRRLLEEIDPMKFDRVIVLSYRDQIHIQKADSKTLLTLIHLRDMRRGTRDFTITSEIIDTRNRALVEEKDDTSDFVASEELVSRALVQISEDFVRKVLLEELLTARGCEFHIRSIEAFNTISPVTFFDISWTAMMQGEIAVGYRNNGKIVFNPIKSELIKFSDDGAVIVLAED